VFKLFLTTFFSLIFLARVTSAVELGKAISVEGEVKLVRNNNESILKPKDLVQESDIIISGKRSSVRLLMIDQTILDINESSRLKISKLTGSDSDRSADLDLDFGKMRSSINKKVKSGQDFKIKTKATVFAVRGTDFFVTSNENSVDKLVVFEGAVLTKTENAEDLGLVGDELTVTEGKLQKSKLTAAQVEAIFQESRNDDKTFYQNLVVEDFRVSRNAGNATIQSVSKLVATPVVQIPKDSFRVPGVNQLSANAVTPGILNFVITGIGIQIQ
jgi:hypothetical protein